MSRLNLASPNSVSTVLTRAVLESVKSWRVSGAAEHIGAAEINFDQELSCSPDSRVPWEVFSELWERTCELDADGTMGVDVARHLGSGRLRGVEYLVRSSKDLGGGLAQLARFQRLLFGASVVEPEPTANGCRFEAHSPWQEPSAASRQFSEFILAVFVMLGRTATGTQWSPHFVTFAHPSPPNPEAHEALFGCPVRFDAAASALEITSSALELPMAEKDPELAATLLSFLEKALGDLPEGTSWARRTASELSLQLPEGEATLGSVSKALAVSERTLQARLSEEDTTFQNVLDHLRHQLAKKYLSQPDLSVPAIAQFLGYSEASAFHRAFRRWSGQTPGKVRRLLVGG